MMGCYWECCVLIISASLLYWVLWNIGGGLWSLLVPEGGLELLSGVMKGLGRRECYGSSKSGAKDKSCSSISWVGLVWDC